MDINNPALNATLDDHSNVDDSFKQDGTTIHLEGGSSYIQNSGNEKPTKPNTTALFKVLCVSILCDFLLGWFLYTSTGNALSRIDAQVESHKAETDKMMEQAREGNIWLMRRDIIYNIDFHTATKTISKKQYQLLKDEVEHYFAIGGNHDVKERWDEFNVEVFGLRNIEVVDAPLTRR